MDLQAYLNSGRGKSINTISLKENEGLEICNEKFVHLYEFYSDRKQKSNHFLVKDGDPIEELYLLINELDIKFDSSVEITDVKLEDETFFLNLKLLDSSNKTIEEAFNYELSRPEVAMEMKALLEQEKVIVYLLLTVDNYLLRISSKEIEINKQIKIKIIDCLNQYLQEYGDYPIEEQDSKEDLLNFDKYNWVDAARYLRANALRFDYIIPWFEDAWNILMFDAPVTSKNIVESEYCSDSKKADIIIWLLSLYDLFFDYQTLIEDEQIDKNDKSSRGKNLINFLDSICENEWEGLISKYLYKCIMDKLNECLITGFKSKYNLYEKGREYFNFYYECEDDYSVSYEALIEEIRKRRNILVERIYRHFNHNDKEIVIFLTGNHWRANYTDYYNRIRNAEKEFDRYLNIVKDMPEKPDDFVDSFEELLNGINGEYPVSVDNIQDQILSVIWGGSYSRYAKLNPVFVWVTIDHMQPLQ